MAEVSMDTISNLSPELQKAFQIAAKAEMRPIEQISKRKESIEARVNLLDDVMGRIGAVEQLLPNLNSPIAIREFTVSSDDERVITGTADKLLAEPGKHSLEISQLAKSASALSNRFPDKDETRVGTGYFRFTKSDGETVDIFVDNDSSTLEGVAQIINSSGIGMKATVVNDPSDSDAPFRLLLNSNKSGSQENIEYPEFYFIDGEEDFFIDEEKPATNARYTFEGFELESSTNEIKDLIKGVTLNLKGLNDLRKPVSVSVDQDLPKTTVKVKDLVDKINNVFSFIQEQNRTNENSDTIRSLGGDYGIRMTEDRFRDALRENFLSKDDKNIKSLFDIGIQFNRQGLLDFDEKKFQNALQGNFDEVVDLLAGDGRSYGIISKLSSAVKSISTSRDGLLSNQRLNYSNRIKQMNDDIKAREKQAQERIETLKVRLSKTQAALSALEHQTNFFQGQSNMASLMA